MLAVKILINKANRDPEFLKEVSYIFSKLDKFSENELCIISDSSSIEMVSGLESTKNKNNKDMIVEFLVKKTISLNKEEFKEKVLEEINILME